MKRRENGLMLPPSTLPPFFFFFFFSPLSRFSSPYPTVFWALSLPFPLSYHLFSLLGLGSFYCLKGTLLTTHICPFIILRGLFYSCPSTVVVADHCLTMLNRNEKASVGQLMHRGVREAHPCQFCNRKICAGGKEKAG